jgi:biotin carboxyl carrier protein
MCATPSTVTRKRWSGGPAGSTDTVRVRPPISISKVMASYRSASRRGREVAAVGEQRIVAPMPGKVLRVLVTAGQEVAARQPLVVVEAMKMENELASPKAGRIREVAVSEGASVEAGRLLVVVE